MVTSARAAVGGSALARKAAAAHAKMRRRTIFMRTLVRIGAGMAIDPVGDEVGRAASIAMQRERVSARGNDMNVDPSRNVGKIHRLGLSDSLVSADDAVRAAGGHVFSAQHNQRRNMDRP